MGVHTHVGSHAHAQSPLRTGAARTVAVPGVEARNEGEREGEGEVEGEGEGEGQSEGVVAEYTKKTAEEEDSTSDADA
eukprot:69025-Pleurochrysis_carterae.AAC.2